MEQTHPAQRESGQQAQLWLFWQGWEARHSNENRPFVEEDVADASGAESERQQAKRRARCAAARQHPDPVAKGERGAHRRAGEDERARAWERQSGRSAGSAHRTQ